jgi:aryl-alcohol dehydrogenase-like predicted oxidoreductase
VQYRELGSTGWKVSSISFGTWALGSEWGAVNDQESLAALHRALDNGVNLFDTADVYGDGRSERLLAQLRGERSEPFMLLPKPAADSIPTLPTVTTGRTSRHLLSAVCEI